VCQLQGDFLYVHWIFSLKRFCVRVIIGLYLLNFANKLDVLLSQV